ncbi:MAG: cytochrome c biogenesis heme-transporting ATPase CcmA [Pseudomonadales bacterium]|jgi:heme exporter protein A|nr:cytochrome c biogenesis heme-transporting ATPase CcmA [Pseudomonadales bacterium]
MLSVSALHCERDERVLFTGLAFTIAAGEVWQVQGQNGSGKTTLLRVLCGLNHDYSGGIFWQGDTITRQAENFRAGVFYLGHSPAINKALTPLQNLRWFCAVSGFADDTAITAALAEQGLRGYGEVPCHHLSAGQQRRVSLARLALSPALLWILDEPFTALDRHGVAALERQIAAKAHAGGSVLLTTHHPLQLDCEVKRIDLDARARQQALSA